SNRAAVARSLWFCRTFAYRPFRFSESLSFSFSVYNNHTVHFTLGRLNTHRGAYFFGTASFFPFTSIKFDGSHFAGGFTSTLGPLTRILLPVPSVRISTTELPLTPMQSSVTSQSLTGVSILKAVEPSMVQIVRWICTRLAPNKMPVLPVATD